MRIALVGPYPAEVGRPNGGVETAVASLAGSLARTGRHEIRVIDPFTGYSPVTPEGFTLIRLPKQPRWRSGVLTVPRPVRKAVADFVPDVVHMHLAPQYARAFPVSVLTVHGSLERETLIRNPGVRGRVASVILARPFRAGLKAAGRVIAISEEVRRLADDVAVTNEFIPNPVAEAFFLGTRSPGADFVSIGEVSRLKNQTMLIDAFGQYVAEGGSGDLVIVGGVGDDDYMGECRQAASALGDRVQFLGRRDQAEVLALLSRARAWVSTSLRETSSIALAESLAAGCPVVSLDVGTASRQVQHPAAGLVLPVSAVAADVARALWEAQTWESDVAALRNLVSDQHPDTVAAQTVQVYEDLLAEVGGGLRYEAPTSADRGELR